MYEDTLVRLRIKCYLYTQIINNTPKSGKIAINLPTSFEYNPETHKVIVKSMKQPQDTPESPFNFSLAYKMDDNGIVTITNVWLKSVWEISAAMSRSANWTVKVQYKNKQIHKLRPAAWYSTRPSKTPIFESLEDYLGALEETIFKYSETRELANSGWKDKLIDAYRKHYGITLNIPRWMDIEAKYRL